MALKDITKLVILVELSDGRLMQVYTNRDNIGTYLECINALENGVSLIDKDWSDNIELESTTAEFNYFPYETTN